MIKNKTIAITADDIKNGNHHIPTRCPVALAISREFDSEFACVGVDRAYILKNATFFEILIPEYIEEWLMKYEFDQEVGPINFEAELEEYTPPEKVSLPNYIFNKEEKYAD